MTSKPVRRMRGLLSPGTSFAASYSVTSPAHLGASLGSRELAGWTPAPGSADADLLPDLDILRSRSRDLFRNSGIAAGYSQTLIDSVIGTGWRLSSTPDYRALGRDKEWAEEWSNGVESLWRSAADTFELDAAGCLKFGGQLTQIFRGGILNGESIILPLWLPRERSVFATRFQVLEADRLSNPQDRLDSERLRGGIEIDPYGRPLAYHIRKTHPGDLYLGLGLMPASWEWERIPAETDWGRRRLIHVHDRERSGQNRGKPILAPVLAQFKMLDHYQRTEVQAAVVNAMIAAFIETPMDPSALTEMLGGDPTDPRFQQWMSAKNEYRVPLKGGGVFQLFPGEKLNSFTPSRPAAQYGTFVENLCRAIGAGLNIPYELILKDFSKTNYSSARAALLEAWRFFLGRRQWLADYAATPMYELWLEEQISAGRIEAPGFYENRYAYCRCRWIGPGRGWVDPVKEAQAAQIRMDSMLSTLEDECAEQGKDWEEVLEQRASEIARMRGLGLPMPQAKPVPSGDQSQPEEQVPASAA